MIRLVMAGAVLMVLSSCTPQPLATATPTPAPTSSSGVPPLHITGQGTADRPVRIVEQHGNRREYELLARSYESRSAQGLARATFYDAQVTFYDEKGTTLVARAPQALLDQASDTVTLMNGVAARSSTGIQLLCDRLTYDRRNSKVHGDGNVHMLNQSGLHMNGNHFDSDVTFTHVSMR